MIEATFVVVLTVAIALWTYYCYKMRPIERKTFVEPLREPSKAVQIVLALLREGHDWTHNRYALYHKPTGIRLWVGRENPKEVTFTLVDKAPEINFPLTEHEQVLILRLVQEIRVCKKAAEVEENTRELARRVLASSGLERRGQLEVRGKTVLDAVTVDEVTRRSLEEDFARKYGTGLGYSELMQKIAHEL